MSARPPIAQHAVLALLLAGCGPVPSPSPSTAPSVPPSVAPTPTAQPTPTEEPGLKLPAPLASDPTTISYKVTVNILAGGSGQLGVVVTNLTQTLVQELVLRWPTAVKGTVLLAPFAPSQQRIREGGDPLVQNWTKWVDGPGESGEPAGTTSLGWGPLLPGGTLTIPVLATRVAPGPLTFDLQILNGNAIMLSDGLPAWTKVTVP